MAADIEGKTLHEPIRYTNDPRLLVNEKAEVRSVEEGFQGSWHGGIVIDQKNHIRIIKYDHFDDLTESIPVWKPYDIPNFRGKIRPVPPSLTHNQNFLHYGQCVDVFYDKAWWEGVVFDYDDGCEERLIFFPDIGDELRARYENIRLTQEWNPTTDRWKIRDDWVFLQVYEELKLEWPVLVSVKQIWYDVRVKNRFVNDMTEWTCNVREKWKEIVEEVIFDNFTLTMKEFFSRLNSSYCPQAVVDYYSLAMGKKFDLRRLKKDAKFREIQIRAKKHLWAVGWSKYEDISGRKLLRYKSPSGQRFKNLGHACRQYIMESSTKNNNPSEHIDKYMVEVSSSKRVCEEVSLDSQGQQTVLSWLIDNKVLLPRSKVKYRCKKNGYTLKEGVVTSDGVKCKCCQNTFSLRKFEFHAGSTYRHPASNIFLEDGRSLLDCQLQLIRDQNARSSRVNNNQHPLEHKHDFICSVCHYGGEIVLCDQCPSSFHISCLGLKEYPDGKWFCPSCCCKICNRNLYNQPCDQSMNSSNLSCEQCERTYHIGCLKIKVLLSKLETDPKLKWFCSPRCAEIFKGLQKLLGKPISVGKDDLTWTLLKYKKIECYDRDASDIEELVETYSKLNVVINVMHECFNPLIEPLTQRDIVEDVVFCRGSELNRLNFKGFYTVVLEKDDELISAATVRVYGEKVAELPLVGTRFQYRRRGMCHILMNELEQNLMKLGVERLVLPSAASMLHAWTTSFGFSIMTNSEKVKFQGYTFLDFQGAKMCHKLLTTGLPSINPSIPIAE